MAKKLVRRGRVRGYRPTREQLEEILELAQRGLGENSIADLRYSQGDEEIYSGANSGKILPENLGEIVNEADNPGELNNLYFSIGQDSPIRRVDIQIGPGDWTTYLIESDDQTWAYGRYHELTEKLLTNRSLYAKGHSARPEILQEGTDKWRQAVWELVSDWRISIVVNLTKALWFVLALEIIVILIAVLYNYDTYPNNKAARNDQRNAEVVLNWFSNNSVILFLINLSYVLMIIFLGRRMKSFLKSKIILQSGSSFFSQLGFQRNRNDAVQLMMLYAAVATLIVTTVALLVQVSS